MAWIYLLFAGAFEVVWPLLMKESNGFTKLLPSLLTILFMIISFALLSFSMKTLPLGTSYTVWVGIGAVGAFILGVVFLNESMNIMRVLAAVLIVSGVIIMKLATK